MCYSVDYKHNIKQSKITVCIPYPLQKNQARRCRRNSTSFVFDNMPTNLFVGHSGKNKVVDLSTPCGVIL